MEPLNRREFMAMAAAPPLLQSTRPPAPSTFVSMFVCMHEASSARFDFKTAMEGYARAGIRAVEPDLTKVREFAQKESPAIARRLLDDLGLTAGLFEQPAWAAGARQHPDTEPRRSEVESRTRENHRSRSPRHSIGRNGRVHGR